MVLQAEIDLFTLIVFEENQSRLVRLLVVDQAKFLILIFVLDLIQPAINLDLFCQLREELLVRFRHVLEDQLEALSFVRYVENDVHLWGGGQDVYPDLDIWL